MFLIAAFASVVSAKTDNPKANVNARNITVTTGNEATSSGNHTSNTVRKLEQLENKVRNPEAREALQLATETTEESEATAESSLTKMNARPGFLKFLLGPDYKNAGQVRSEIVHLRNQVAQLTRLKAKVPTADQTSIDQAIAALNADLLSIETQLSKALEGFSLLGWLSKLLTGFVAPVASPTPTATGSATPSVSPTATATPTESPLATPTATPELSPTP